MRGLATLAFAAILAIALAAAYGAAAKPAAPPAAPAKPGFTDVTRESGVAAILDAKYAKQPDWWLSGQTLVDLDGDGILDLFLSVHGPGGAVAALGDGHGHFTPAAGSWPGSEIHLAYDLNEDGKVDLQMTWRDGGGQWWINESVPGRLAFRETPVTADQARMNAVIDIDRDGRADWLHELPGIVFELGDGRGGFKRGPTLEIDKSRFEYTITPVDLNGDGFIDLVVRWGRYDFKEGKSRIYLNDGKMHFTDATAQAGLAEDGLSIMGVGDVNQDGSPDLIVLEHMKPEIYLNDGKGHFTKKAGALAGMDAASRPIYGTWGLAVVTDFDNDGIADILWDGRCFLWALRGTGGGNFQYMNKAWGIDDTASAAVDDGLCFGDIDGDGRLDIIGYTGNIEHNRRLKVYHNDLAAGNWVRVRPVGAAGNRGAAGAKIRLTEAGDPAKLLWYEQVQIVGSQSAHSYYAYARTERHFGLGDRKTVNIAVEFYPSGKKVERRGVAAGTTVEIAEDGPPAPPLKAEAPTGPATRVTLAAPLPAPADQPTAPTGSATPTSVEPAAPPARPAVLEAMKSADDAVRIAALKALGSVGLAEDVPALVAAAAETGGDEQKAARWALDHLPGDEASNRLMAALANAEPVAKAEAIRALAAHGTAKAAPLLVDALLDKEAAVRLEAIRGLDAVGADEAAAPLAILLVSSPMEWQERDAAEKALAAVCLRSKDRDGLTDSLAAVMTEAAGPAKVSLLRTLGRIGGPKAAKAVMEAVNVTNSDVREAAIRTLAAWPDISAAEALLDIAWYNPKTLHQPLPANAQGLAIRGLVRLAGLKELGDDERLLLLQKTYHCADQPEDKKLVLGALGNVGTENALLYVAGSMDDSEVAEEAAAAAVRIARTARNLEPGAVRAAMEEVLAVSKTEATLKAAQAVIAKLPK